MTNSVEETSDIIHPLAQTIRIVDDGCYITSIGLYFAAKPNLSAAGVQDLPITVELRPTVNGYPDSEKIFERARVLKYSADISVSADATVETKFTFPIPVRVEQDDEIAVCIYTSAPNKQDHTYLVWKATLDKFIVGSNNTQKYVSQPEAGVVFVSSNGTVWEPDQTSDLKFKLYKATFNDTTATAHFKLAPPPRRQLTSNPLQFRSGDSDVVVYQKGHGFQVGDKARLYPGTTGFDSSSSIAGMYGYDLFGYRTVTFADNDYYVIKAAKAANTTIKGGGSRLLADQHYRVDRFVPKFQTTNITNTTIDIEGSFTTTKSYAAFPFTQENYNTTNEWSLLNNMEQWLESPLVIPTTQNEDVHLAGRDATTILVTLGAKNTDDVTAIDLEKSSFVSITNLIDYQSGTNIDYDSGTPIDGYNVPYRWVNETSSGGGSSSAKYITTPVALSSPAKGLNIFVDACRQKDTDFDLYYRTMNDDLDSDLSDNSWILADTTPPNSNYNDIAPASNNFDYREYNYMIGGTYSATLTDFDRYQLKFVLKSRNTTIFPTLKNLRVIALAD